MHRKFIYLILWLGDISLTGNSEGRDFVNKLKIVFHAKDLKNQNCFIGILINYIKDKVAFSQIDLI